MPARLALLACGILLAGFALMLFLFPRLYGYILMEDLPPEWFQFFCLAVAAWYWAKAALARRRDRVRWGLVFCAGLASFCLFVAGEEISWGQRIIGYRTPAYFAERNVQREVTIHNFAYQLVEPRRLAMVLMAVYGAVLPALALVKPVKRRVETWGVPLPGIGSFVCFALAVWLMTMPFTETDDEVGEVFFALGLFFAASQAGGPRSRRAVLRTVGILGLLSLGASMLCFLRPAHRQQVRNVGHLQAGQALEGVGRRWEAAREYEMLARYWRTDWGLWTKVIGMYHEEGDLSKAWGLSTEFIRLNTREWRPYEVIAEIGKTTGMEEDARRHLQTVLVDEPYNDYARWALLILEGRRPFVRSEE